MRFNSLFTTALSLLLASSSAFAATEGAVEATATPVSVQTGLDLLEFRLSHYSVFQAGGGNSFSAWGSWNPIFKFNPTWGARAALGMGLAKGPDSADGSPLLIGEFGLLASYQLSDSFSFEAGPGLQRWFTSKSTPITTTLGGVYTLDSRLLGFIQGAAVDYTTIFLSNNLSHQIRVGVTF